MNLVVATSNKGKVAELKRLLPAHIQLLTAGEAGILLPEETGIDFVENALIKARAAATTGKPAIADDSGLQVDALGGAPGVFSARFAGDDATDEANNDKLVELLDGLSPKQRSARFVSAVAVVTSAGEEYCAIGSVEGCVVMDPRGANGFGYDPHFEINDPAARGFNGMTMAEISIEEKNAISHRSRAYRNLLSQLELVGFFSNNQQGSPLERETA